MTEGDLEIINRCLEGDVDSFGILVDKYQGPVFNVVLRMVRNYEDAREISQDVFVKAFENLRGFNREKKFFSWIYRIAINESINFIDRDRPREELPRGLATDRHDPVREYEATETGRLVHGALDEIGPDYRAVILLRHFFHLSYREIAGILEVPEKTVKSRLFDGRRLLRDLLVEKGLGTHHDQ